MIEFDDDFPPVHLAPFAKKLGISRVRVDDDVAEYTLPWDPGNTTIADLVHGGALLSLADCTVTGAAWSRITEPEHYRGVTVDINLAFVSGARATDVNARAAVRRRGSSLCFCEVELYSEEGELVACGQGVYKLSRSGSV